MDAYKSIIRLVPDGLRNEKFNIGIILESKNYFKWEINLDKIYIIKKYLYPDLNIGLIKNAINDLEDILIRERIKNINIYNGLIRFTEFKGLLTDNLDDEFDELMTLYVL